MSLIQVKPDHSDAQSALSKLEKTPVEEIQTTTQNLRRYVPNLELCPEETKEYYRDILQGGKTFHGLALKSEGKIDEIQTDLNGILSQCKSLWNQLDVYKHGYYQQKFDINQYRVELKRIDESTRSLKKIDKELGSMEESLNTINFDGDPMKHLGQELTEEDFRRYLQISNAEKESVQRYEEILNDLRQIDEELHDKELKLKESNKKIQELTETIAKLNKQSEERDFLIQEKEKFILTCAEESERLRVKSDDEYASKLSDKMSKDEKQREKMEESRSNKNDEFNEMVSNLYRQLSQNAAINSLMHYILVLDQSGSMQGSRWIELIKAVNMFAKQNQSQTTDLLSVITFDHTATEVMKKIKFSDYQTPSTQKWGGTNFDEAFKMARDISNLSRTHRPVVVFLTDGEGTMRETPSILREMSDLHKDRGFMLFSVGVGDGFNIEALKMITRTANGGNLFLDFGNERIEFLRTTRDEKVLVKFFMEISNALNTLPLKIKAAIETLKKERIEFDEEAKRQCEFNIKMSKLELEDTSGKLQDLLERRIKVLEMRKEEEKSQIDFFKKQKEDIKKEIETLESELRDVSRLVTLASIEALKEEKKKREEQKLKAWEERQKLSVDRAVILEVLEKSKSSTKMSTSLQLFDFLKEKEKAKFLKDKQQVSLSKMRNFIKPIIQDSSYVEESLKVTTAGLSSLEEDGILDILFEQYRTVIDIEHCQDSANFRKIAYRVLELKETDSKGLEAFELLMDCFQPRTFVNPNISDEDRKNIINGFVDNKYRFDIEVIDAQYDRLNTDCKKTEGNLELAKYDLKKMKDEMDELKEKKPKQEKKVKKLKAKVSKSQRKAEADKENVKRNSNIDNEESDEDDEEKLEAAVEKLQEIEEKIRGKKLRKKSLKEFIKSLEEQLRGLKSERLEVESQKSEKEKEKGKMKERVLSHHARLKVELMARVNKYVKDTNFNKIEVFEKNLMANLVKPISDYMTQQT